MRLDIVWSLQQVNNYVMMQVLPVDEHLPEIVSVAARESRLIIQAPPGTGKSTRVPVGLQKGLALGKKLVAVAEPRRVAARLLAERVANELGERVGETVGYRVRFEQLFSERTRVFYATSGVLLRQFAGASAPANIGCLIIDEFHERHLDTDLLLALALHHQETAMPELRIVVMSATLDVAQVQKALQGCSCVSVPQLSYPVSIDYVPDDGRPLAKQVASAVRCLAEDGRGDILTFLPGAKEIRAASEALESLTASQPLNVVTLHGDMPLAAQAEVMRASERRRVILATNIAESAVTVPGVTAVIDSGLARRANCSPWSGLSSLELHKISQASATQRAGRAGRLGPGRAIRLYSKHDFEARPGYDSPEILRLELCEPLLLLNGAGISEFSELRFVDQPSPTQVAAARQLLSRLDATRADGQLTASGRAMLKLPLHPRLSRLVINCQQSEIPRLGCLVAALLSERDLRLDVRVRGTGFARGGAQHTADSDIEELIEAFEVASAARFDPRVCSRERIDAGVARRVAAACRQIEAALVAVEGQKPSVSTESESLGKAILKAYPDRVAWRRQPAKSELVMANGASARLGDYSVVRDAEFLVAIDADDVVDSGKRGVTYVRLASRIEVDWILELNNDWLKTEEQFVWAPGAQRVECQSFIKYGSIVLEQCSSAASPGPDVATLLARRVIEQGIHKGTAVGRLQARISLVRRLGLLPDLPALDDASIQSAVASVCADRVDLDGVDDEFIAACALHGANPAQVRLLERYAPEKLQLPGGRQVKINYESEQAPWVESRLQDFFGMGAIPAIAEGRQPLTVHLLAPNFRSVQVTQDLAGFWEKHYPSIRRELMRRYPRHQWPEDGRNAVPPQPRPPRSR